MKTEEFLRDLLDTSSKHAYHGFTSLHRCNTYIPTIQWTTKSGGTVTLCCARNVFSWDLTFHQNCRRMQSLLRAVSVNKATSNLMLRNLMYTGHMGQQVLHILPPRNQH